MGWEMEREKENEEVREGERTMNLDNESCFFFDNLFSHLISFRFISFRFISVGFPIKPFPTNQAFRKSLEQTIHRERAWP